VTVRVSEQDLQATLLEAARLFGWRVYHQRPAQTSRGWRTALTGDRGFPDLIAARSGRVFALELKSAGGRLREGQAEWLHALNGGLVTARLVYPDDLDELLALLTRREPPAS
jgi:hypothetical protein